MKFHTRHLVAREWNKFMFHSLRRKNWSETDEQAVMSWLETNVPDELYMVISRNQMMIVYIDDPSTVTLFNISFVKYAAESRGRQHWVTT